MSELNIYQKLIEVRKSVPGLAKDKENKFFKFAYVSSSKTLAAVRAEMDKQQLLLIPAILSHETDDHTTAKGGHQFKTILTMQYTWLNAENPDEKVICPWIGIGLDEGEKGPGKAVTYSEKYFLLKFFNVPTDSDDPDSSGKQNGKKETGKKAPAKSDKTKDDKIKLIHGWLGDMGRWGFEEQKDGSILRYKIEKQESVKANALSALKTISAFPGKDGKDDFKGFTSMDKLKTISDNWLNSVYGNVQTEHKVWKEKFDNSQENDEPDDGGDLPF